MKLNILESPRRIEYYIRSSPVKTTNDQADRDGSQHSIITQAAQPIVPCIIHPLTRGCRVKGATTP